MVFCPPKQKEKRKKEINQKQTNKITHTHTTKTKQNKKREKKNKKQNPFKNSRIDLHFWFHSETEVSFPRNEHWGRALVRWGSDTPESCRNNRKVLWQIFLRFPVPTTDSLYVPVPSKNRKLFSEFVFRVAAPERRRDQLKSLCRGKWAELDLYPAVK